MHAIPHSLYDNNIKRLAAGHIRHSIYKTTFNIY